MIGRTPEYLGKKITAAETRLAVLYALLTPAVVLVLTAVAIATDAGRAGMVTNGGTRGFTEVLFAYASSMANNGQTMAGLNANSVFYNVTTARRHAGWPLRPGRVGVGPGRAIRSPAALAEDGGTLPADSATFGVLVLATIVLVGAVCFLPALALGPIAEALQH